MQMQPHPIHSKRTLTLSPLFNTTHLSLKHRHSLQVTNTHTNVEATTIDVALLWSPQSTKCQMVQPWSHWQRNTTTDMVNQSLESMRLGEQWMENWWKRKWPITKKEIAHVSWVRCCCIFDYSTLTSWLDSHAVSRDPYPLPSTAKEVHLNTCDCAAAVATGQTPWTVVSTHWGSAQGRTMPWLVDLLKRHLMLLSTPCGLPKPEWYADPYHNIKP